MSSQTKFQAMSKLDSFCMLHTRRGICTPSPEPFMGDSFVMNQVPHKSCEFDMQTSHHPHMHGLWPHEGGGNCSESPMVFSTKTRSMGPLGLGRSPAFKGGSPDVNLVTLC